MKCRSPTHPRKLWTFEVGNILPLVLGSPQGKAGSPGWLGNGILPLCLPATFISTSGGYDSSLPRSSQEQRMGKEPAWPLPGRHHAAIPGGQAAAYPQVQD